MPLDNDTSFTLHKNGIASGVGVAIGVPIGAVEVNSVRVYIATSVDMAKGAIIQRSIETLLRAVKFLYATTSGEINVWILPGGAASSVVTSVPLGTNYIRLDVGADLANKSQSGLVVETTNEISDVILEQMKGN